MTTNILIFRQGGALASVLAVVTLGVLMFVGASTMPRLGPQPPAPPSANEVRDTLARLGLIPERLAAAGLTGDETGSLTANLRAHLNGHIQELRDADQAFFTAKGNWNRLEPRVRGGVASAAEMAEWTEVQAALQAATDNRRRVLSGAMNAASAGLPEAKLASFRIALGNARWEVPMRFHFSSRTAPQWVGLRDALANGRINTERGAAPDPARAALVEAAEAEPATMAAAAGLRDNLADVQAEWDAAVAP